MSQHAVKGVTEVDVRTKTFPLHHDAVWIKTINGTELILDWHATLNPVQPIVTTYEAWCHGSCPQ